MKSRPAGDSRVCVIDNALRGENLAAQLVHVNPNFAPLLRINPTLVGACKRPAVLAWADRLIQEDCRGAILRADGVQALEEAHA